MLNFELLFLQGFSSKNYEILHKDVLTPQEYEYYYKLEKNAACITLLHTKLISQLDTVDCVQRANYMKQKYFDCNEHNFIFVKLETFNTHMTSQRFLVLCRHRIILFSVIVQTEPTT